MRYHDQPVSIYGGMVEPPLIGALVLFYLLQPALRSLPSALCWFVVAGGAAALFVEWQ